MTSFVPPGIFRHMAQITNAQKSTGPKTDIGKATAARNALLHGLTARLETLECEPNDRSNELLRELVADIRPSDTREWAIVKTIQRSMIGMDRCREIADANAAKRIAEAADLRRERELIEVEELADELDERPKYVMHRLLRTEPGVQFISNRLTQFCSHQRGVWDTEHLRLALNFNGVRARDALDDEIGFDIARLIFQHGDMDSFGDLEDPKNWEAVYNYFEPLRGDRDDTVFERRIQLLVTTVIDEQTFVTELGTFLDRIVDRIAKARKRLKAERAEIAHQDAVLAMEDLTSQGALLHRYETGFERSNSRAWRELREHRGIKSNHAFDEIRDRYKEPIEPEAMTPWLPEQWEQPVAPATAPEPKPEPTPEPEPAPEPASENLPNEPRCVYNERSDHTGTSTRIVPTPAADPPPNGAR